MVNNKMNSVKQVLPTLRVHSNNFLYSKVVKAKNYHHQPTAFIHYWVLTFFFDQQVGGLPLLLLSCHGLHCKRTFIHLLWYEIGDQPISIHRSHFHDNQNCSLQRSSCSMESNSCSGRFNIAGA